MKPFPPGLIGSLDQLGVVQPHDGLTDKITNGEVPSFANSKV